MEPFYIRELQSEEYPLLEEFLYQAIFQKDPHHLIPREVIYQPEVFVFIKDFGKFPDDYALAYETQGKIVGVVWARLLNQEIKGFGNVDNHTPELAISCLNAFRNRGIGTKLMREILTQLKKKGYQKCSLAVQKTNYALKMYKKVGFSVLKETDEEYIMVCELTE